MLLLDKLVEQLEFTVHPFALCRIGAGQRLSLGSREQSTVHYVLAGDGELVFAGLAPYALRRGTIVIAPPGVTQDVRGSGEPSWSLEALRQCVPPKIGIDALEKPGTKSPGGIAMLCGSVDATYRHLNSVFDHLPAPIVEHTAEGEVIWRVFENIVRELAEPRPGSIAMLRALFQQCFIEILRNHFAGGRSEFPWLGALQDSRLGKAVEKILDNPGRPHTLESLAQSCHMSRTTFAKRFSEAFGRSPMNFLAEIRLRNSAKLLIQSEYPIKQIATRIGYDSRSHFSRPFKEFYGISPVNYRETFGNRGDLVPELT